MPRSRQMICSGKGTETDGTMSTTWPALIGSIRAWASDRHLVFQLSYDRWLESGLHQAAVPGVLRGIGVHHGGRVVVVDRDLFHQDAIGRSKKPRIGARSRDVSVEGNRPETWIRAPRHGRLGPKAGVKRKWIVLIEGGVKEGGG